MQKQIIMVFIFLSFASTCLAQSEYPISKNTLQEVLALKAKLIEYQGDLSQMTESASTGQRIIELISVANTVKEVMENLNAIHSMLVIESWHGERHQFLPQALNFIKQQHIEALLKTLDINIEYYNNLSGVQKDPLLIRQYERSIDYFRKAKLLLDKINQELPYKDHKLLEEIEKE